MKDSTVKPRRSRAWWVVGLVGVVALAGAGTWFATRYNPTSPKTTSHDTAATPTISQTSTAALDPVCDERAKPPETDELSIVDISVTIDEDRMDFEFYARNDTKLNAVHPEIAIHFTKDDQDVTQELGGDYLETWSHNSAVFQTGLNLYSDQDVEVPDGWTQDNISLDVTVGSVEYWCTPKETK